MVKIIIIFLKKRSSTPESGDTTKSTDGGSKQYNVDKSFADRRHKVTSARTYFYLNEATCERNMEIFIQCLEAVSGEIHFVFLFSYFNFKTHISLAVC